jgi:hypothetical protein
MATVYMFISLGDVDGRNGNRSWVYILPDRNGRHGNRLHVYILTDIDGKFKQWLSIIPRF